MSQVLMQLNDDMTEWLRDKRLRIGERVSVGEVMARFRLPPAMRADVSGLLDAWVGSGFLRKFGPHDQLTERGYDLLYPESVEESERVVREDLYRFMRDEGLRAGSVFLLQKYVAQRRTALNPKQEDVVPDVVDDLLNEDHLRKESNGALTVTDAGMIAISRTR